MTQADELQKLLFSPVLDDTNFLESLKRIHPYKNLDNFSPYEATSAQSPNDLIEQIKAPIRIWKMLEEMGFDPSFEKYCMIKREGLDPHTRRIFAANPHKQSQEYSEEKFAESLGNLRTCKDKALESLEKLNLTRDYSTSETTLHQSRQLKNSAQSTITDSAINESLCYIYRGKPEIITQETERNNLEYAIIGKLSKIIDKARNAKLDSRELSDRCATTGHQINRPWSMNAWNIFCDLAKSVTGEDVTTKVVPLQLGLEITPNKMEIKFREGGLDKCKELFKEIESVINAIGTAVDKAISERSTAPSRTLR